MFLAYGALGGNNSISQTPTNISNINKVILQNGIYDDLYITKEVASSNSPISKDWDFSTILHAQFKNNSSAGNVDFQVSQCSSLRIKRREKGKFLWTMLFEIPVTKLEDLTVERFTGLCRGGKTEYEFAIVPILNGVESNYNINTVVSDFDGIVLSEKDKTFLTPLEPKVTRQRNRQSSILNTLDGKYPVVVINSQNNYDSGTASGVFIQLDENTCEFDYENGWKYRDNFMDFLSDGKPKFLKLEDGRAWLISIVETPSETYEDTSYKTTTTFSWVQIGDVDSTQGLVDNDLADFDTENW